MIDIHDNTHMDCVMSRDGDIELRIGRHAEAFLLLTRSGADKLIRALSAVQAP